jgi:ribokinase
MGFRAVKVSTVNKLQPLKVDLSASRYRAAIGTGAVGSGIFFSLDGNHTLGREESRSGRFLDQRDYCKLHIILHYVATLLPAPFQTIPISYVGEDELGQRMLTEMDQAGMDLRYVQVYPGEQTLMAVCFVYPDGSGGNLTPDHSASSRVGPELIRSASEEFQRYERRGLVLAAPEVSLEARHELLVQAGRYSLLRAACFTSGELREPISRDLLAKTDLLSINIDEAAALTGCEANSQSEEEIVRAAFAELARLNPAMQAAVTAGSRGSWGWDGEKLHFVPGLPIQVACTAGAGDAFIAGLIVARVAGLEFGAAQQLAALIASLSITSPHSIHPELDRRSLRAFARQVGVALDREVARLLEEEP